MTAHPTTSRFKDNAHEALGDDQLQKAMLNVRAGFIDKRAAVAAKLPEFEALRDSARDIKNHTLAHLDLYLERYEQKVIEAGGHVHWARTAEEARGFDAAAGLSKLGLSEALSTQRSNGLKAMLARIAADAKAG
jgi:L-lactate dehydrogenase complex protein LldF